MIKLLYLNVMSFHINNISTSIHPYNGILDNCRVCIFLLIELPHMPQYHCLHGIYDWFHNVLFIPYIYLIVSLRLSVLTFPQPLNPIIHIASISPSMKHAAIFFSPATRGSFKTVYEDSDAEGGPILWQRVFHQLFKPSVESGDLKWIASLPLLYYGVFFGFFWGGRFN